MTTRSPIFTLVPPTGPARPIVVSVPHCGTAIPPELAQLYSPEAIEALDDTDWFVEQLYSFAPDVGITLVYAHFSRYLIDLNRDPESKPLYDDGRTLTELVPTTTFSGQPMYRSDVPDAAAIEARKQQYYWPYHRELQRILGELKQRFGAALLWEAHSIRRRVPTIRAEPFPDMILGDCEGHTAAAALSQAALESISSRWPGVVQHNDPFKGGYITRSFGRPDEGIHALQLEMAKDLYMDEETTTYAPQKAEAIAAVLQETLATLAALVEES